MAPIWGMRPQVGVDAVVPAFLIIVLGGVGSLWGAVRRRAAGRPGRRPHRRLRVRVVAAVDVPAVHRRRHLPLARPVRQEERPRHMNLQRPLWQGQGGAGDRRRRDDGPRGRARPARRRLPRRRWSTSTAAATAGLVRDLGHRVVAVPATSADPARSPRRMRVVVKALGRRRHPGQQRRHPLQQQAGGDERRRMAPRPRRQPRRRVLLVAGGGAGDEGAALGPHRQHRLARGQDRRPHRRHRLRGLEGRARRAHLLARARAGGARRHRQRDRAGLRARRRWSPSS